MADQEQDRRLFAWRQMGRVIIATSLAVVMSMVVFGHIHVWVLFAAWMFVQMDEEVPARQRLELAFVAMLGLFLAGLGTIYIRQQRVIETMALVPLLMEGYCFYRDEIKAHKWFLHMLFFSVILILAVWFPVGTMPLFRDRFIAAGMGVAIGFGCGSFLFPLRVVASFQKNLLPIWSILSDYLTMLTEVWLHQKTVHALIPLRLRLEYILQMRPGTYPEWVYDRGFHPGLRSSFRFFLIQIERLIEIVFSMHYFAMVGIRDRPLLNVVADDFTIVMKQNVELVVFLQCYFQGKKVSFLETDITCDIEDLDRTLARVMPPSFWLLGHGAEEMLLIAFAREMKDMRYGLLQLILALPPSDVKVEQEREETV